MSDFHIKQLQQSDDLLRLAFPRRLKNSPPVANGQFRI
jgi:hypothetical protein